ncbi:peptidylprolyl isomerase [Acetobacteraceae bacterium H6797]|nr:peptidylprolyl isomerase [Acetobacteraceae bacterium H6797]
MLLVAGLAGGVAVSPGSVEQPFAFVPRAEAQTNRILAVVNGDVVTQGEVEARARLFALNAGLQSDPAMVQRLQPQILRLLIDERLRLQETQRRRIAVTDQEVAEAVKEIETRNGMPSGGLVAQLRRSGVEPRALYDQIRVQISWARFVRGMMGSQARPSDAEVNEFIAAWKARTGQKEYLVSEIFVPIDDPANEGEVKRFVDDVVGQLRRGVPFAVAATQFSQSQTALQGGDIGWTRADELDPEVASVVTRMPIGAIANPIRVPGGFQIVQLRQSREIGNDMATMLSIRQAFLPFQGRLDPNAPTPQQIAQVEKARAAGQGCAAVEALGAGDGRPVDPGPVRLENVQGPIRALLAGLAPGKTSQPIITPDGVMLLAVCSRETRNLAEMTPDQARAQIFRDRAENVSRQQQRDLRRRAQIDRRA